MTTNSYLPPQEYLDANKYAVGNLSLENVFFDVTGPYAVPNDLRTWLARLRLLEGVPFAYLVADSALLPPESIRYFYVDRRWTDALVQGALSVASVTSEDRSRLEQIHATIRADVDRAERTVRPVGGEGAKATSGTITGFLLRSRAVSGWPGLHVRAYDRELDEAAGDNAIVPESDTRRLRLLRLERLAPAVLFALFDGVPAIVHIEEPRRGIQFGVRLDATAEPKKFAPWIAPRDVTNPQKQISGKIPVPCRKGSPGVLDLKGLSETLVTRKATTKVGTEADSAEVALEMIRFPYRQVFGDETKQLGTVFQPTVAIKVLAEKIKAAS